MYNTNNSRKEYKWIYLQTLKQWFVAKIGSCRVDPHILRNRWREIISLWHQKGVNSTYNLPNDLFLMKQLYMGTYVFKICKILEISSWSF
jgi:hypothetical protein